ncbi:hypothetical protein SAMN06269185_1890 [Natronoarchaeum philippinense]|uniref:Double zinc ribbon n=1 Tax=Natronoarchaeum philippinense TaxID=558529 RepID=A0A285NTF2_NATPI|nr:zinc ribbon domain-containing protein [Natronoarchaeum philippinense]SNZ12725.1 hypothetical protein SAMN06269185_1890 [Natronoarchaeum philippinense]
MSKITFRADDDLVEELETFETSKSEVMRQALREYLAGSEAGEAGADPSESSSDAEDGLDGLVAARIDELVEQRVDAALESRLGANDRDAGARPAGRQDVNVNVTVEDARATAGDGSSDEQCKTPAAEERMPDGEGQLDDAVEEETRRRTCGQCGESVDGEHVYCPNCGEKAARRVFCECGDELRSDWAFCPGCGRRTAAADVLDSP